MLPPKYVKAARIHNRTNNTALVTVVFGPKPGDDNGNSRIIEEQTIAPNESKEFERVHNMGSWTAVAEVEKISASFLAEKGTALATTTSAPDFIVKADRIIGMQEYNLVTTAHSEASFVIQNGCGD